MTKHENACIRTLEQHSFSVLKIRKRNHLVIHAEHHPSGRTGVFVVGASPSDYRSYRNFKAFVRRFASAA